MKPRHPSPLSRIVFASALALLGGATVGCSNDPPANTGSPSAAKGSPPMKEYAATSDDRLGKLADGTGIPVGSAIPAAHALDLDGKDVALATLVAKGPILIIVYRGGWCPYCNFEIHSFTQAYPDFQKRHVTPVAISVDRPESAAKTQATYSIPFPVLSDSNALVLDAFHVVKHVDDAELAKLKGYGIDLEAASGNAHHVIAIPALFIVDRSGIVRWAHSDPTYTVRPTISQILAAIDASGMKSD